MPLRGVGIAPGLNQNVERDTILIDGAPEIVLHAADPDEDFVHVPLVPWPWPVASQAVGKALAEFLAPAPYGRGVRTQLQMHSSITEKRYELTGQGVDGDV